MCQKAAPVPTLTLNELIDRLFEIRANNPETGELPVFVWQQDGDRHPITMVDDTNTDCVDLNIPPIHEHDVTCPHCQSKRVITVDNEGLCHNTPDFYDSTIYVTSQCLDCKEYFKNTGNIYWNADEHK